MHSPVEPALVLAVIPARYASTRFPGKPLVEIAGKPMIQHVWERAREASLIDRVIIATDDERIASSARGFGAEVVMTAPDHPSGTDRIWEVAKDLPQYGWVLNVQGDEPQISPQVLDNLVARARGWTEADISTLGVAIPASDTEGFHDPNVVKIALAESGRALYFSRAAIPLARDGQSHLPGGVLGYRHVGVYLYRRTALARFVQLPPSPLEQTEKLEQLRALEAGMAIYAVLTEKAPVGIDTPADLERLLALVENQA